MRTRAPRPPSSSSSREAESSHAGSPESRELRPRRTWRPPGADGDVYANDYRSSMWVQPYAPEDGVLALSPTAHGDERRKSGRRNSIGNMATLKLKDAVIVVQSAVRRSKAWQRAAERALKFYTKHLDPESGFYYYQRDTGETQWHKPAVLLGTRRRRGFCGHPKDCPEPEQSRNDELAEYASQDYHPEVSDELGERAGRVLLPPSLGRATGRDGTGRAEESAPLRAGRNSLSRARAPPAGSTRSRRGSSKSTATSCLGPTARGRGEASTRPSRSTNCPSGRRR